MLEILNKINEPKDLKGLAQEELKELSSEIREILLKKLSIHGGHFEPNFGMVEEIIAMHYVFNSPKLQKRNKIADLCLGRKERNRK